MMKPNQFVVYDQVNPECGALDYGDTYTLGNVNGDTVTLLQFPDKEFPIEAFSVQACNHRDMVMESRRRKGYRYRVYRCEKCERKRHSVEIEIDEPGKGRQMEHWRVELMNRLSGDQCRALSEFLDYMEGKRDV